MKISDVDRWNYVRRHVERSYQDDGRDCWSCSHDYEWGVDAYDENLVEEGVAFRKWVDKQIEKERNPPIIARDVAARVNFTGEVWASAGHRVPPETYEVFGLPYWLENKQ